MSEREAPKRNIQQFFVPILVVVAIGLAFFSGTMWQKVKSLENGSSTTGGAVAGASTQPQATVTLDTIKGLFSNKGVITFGDANRKVLFVEIADPSCPYCHIADGNDPQVASAVGSQFKYVSDGGSYDPPVTEMEKLVNSGQASFAYIYYPGHGNGEMAMKALFCANEQGKFWDVNSLLMSQAGYQIQNGYDATGKTVTGTVVGNDKTKSAALAQFLKSAIDPAFMQSCLDSGKYDSYLTNNQSLATSMSVQGTPDFYVNTTNFPGAYSYTNMKSAVDAALK